jgi:hypothetical protein
MSDDLEKSLQKAIEEKELAEKLESKLKLAEEQLNRAQEKSKKLEKILKKEENDVTKLEKLSLTGLFATILGNKEQKIKKERQEFLAAKLKYDTNQELIVELAKDINTAQEEMKLYDHIGVNYEVLLQRKEEVLISQQGKPAQELLLIAEEKGMLAAEEKELREAEAAAQAVVCSLNELMGTLKSAEEWGYVDMIGGGMITTYIKHSKIDKAKSQIITVQNKLHRLQRELKDLKIDSNLEMNVGGLATFADYFFDGLIVDWIVQKGVSKTKSTTEGLQLQVEGIWRAVKGRHSEVNRRTDELITSKRLLIKKSSIDQQDRKLER